MQDFRSIAYVTHPQYQNHDTGGADHPETPERLLAINKRLRKSPLNSVIETITPDQADRYWIKTCHDESYLFRFEETALSGKSYLDHPDNQICFESYQIAKLSTGAGLTGIDLLENDNTDIAFCCVRPPGHHAEKAMALGFCFFNNSAIAARYWQQKHSKKKNDDL